MFENKNILILGLAKSGTSCAKFLARKGNKVVINDKKETYDEDVLDELKSLGVEVVLGSHPDELMNSDVDYLVKNPGVPIDHKYVLKANELNIPVLNEVEVAYHYLRKKDIKIIAITGSNGKTTTTTLVYEFLKEDKKDVYLVGNIGFPLCDFVDIVKDGDILVMEISCQQLENTKEFRPDVAIMTNIVEAHIDFMKTFDHYKYVKSKLLMNQTSNDIAILNKENSTLLEVTKSAKSIKKYFSSKVKNDVDSYLEDDSIYYKSEKIISTDDLILRGVHNYENIMGAIMGAKEFNCSTTSIVSVLKRFSGVEHRLEFVCNKNGRIFYNDTEATNIKCTQIALDSFTEPTIIILGGLERGQNFNDLKPHSKNIKAIVAMGECKERVKEFGDSINVPTYVCDYITDSTEKAYEISSEGDVILLSPGSASWDQYERCEVRGDLFKEYANSIKED